MFLYDPDYTGRYSNATLRCRTDKVLSPLRRSVSKQSRGDACTQDRLRSCLNRSTTCL